MNFRASSVLLLLLCACATTEPRTEAPVAHDPRIANLQRAAELPWLDDGRCAVQEASLPWDRLIGRCHHALDMQRLRFQDTEGRCPVAAAGAVAVPAMVAICLLSQPVMVGAVIVLGTVVVASAIDEALEAHARTRRTHPRPTSRK